MLNTLFSGMGTENPSSYMTAIIFWFVVVGVMYFIMLRPQQKKKKQEEAMRNELKIGDEITTIGGIIGKVVSIKDETDSVVIETGIDRSKVNIRKWAIASVDTLRDSDKK